jgi:hypothetical protein
VTDYTEEDLKAMRTDEILLIASERGFPRKTRADAVKAILRMQWEDKFDEARRRAVKNAG